MAANANNSTWFEKVPNCIRSFQETTATLFDYYLGHICVQRALKATGR
jgi:hypothetical protein